VRFDVYAGPLRLAQGLECEVHAFDWDRRIVGAVDRFDLQRWHEAMERGDIGDCGDFNGDGLETEGDSLLLATHHGHHRPRRLIAPNGGESWSVGSMQTITWAPGGGDSAFAALFLTRDSDPGFRLQVAANLPDTGATAWTVDSTLINGPDYRVEVVHTAGVFDANINDPIGGDTSDSPFAITGSTVSIQPDPGDVPLRFAMDPGRPNPFRRTLTIAFSPPVPEHVRLKVFDLQGRVLRTVVDAKYEPGRWEVIWDGADQAGHRLPAGLYLLRLEAGSHRAQRKALLLK
jgi:hypothetical protein